jgi:hypothetical protein
MCGNNLLRTIVGLSDIHQEVTPKHARTEAPKILAYTVSNIYHCKMNLSPQQAVEAYRVVRRPDSRIF